MRRPVNEVQALPCACLPTCFAWSHYKPHTLPGPHTENFMRKRTLTSLLAAGESNAELEALASASGMFAQHCSLEEFEHLMRTAVLRQPAADWSTRAAQALTLAGVAQHAAERWLPSTYA